MVKNQYLKYYLISFTYIILSFSLGVILQNGLILFLMINMSLATVVVMITQLITHLSNKKIGKIKSLLLLIGWILFFPNAYYILTDLIHFQQYDFFLEYPDVYHFDFKVWLIFTHITIGALYAMKLGIFSLDQVQKIYPKQHSSKKVIIISALFILSSVGIYIGRFIRLNSWDFFKVFTIFKNIILETQFFIGFISLFFIIHWVTYLLFSNKGA